MPETPGEEAPWSTGITPRLILQAETAEEDQAIREGRLRLETVPAGDNPVTLAVAWEEYD